MSHISITPLAPGRPPITFSVYNPNDPEVIVNPDLAGDPADPEDPGDPRVCKDIPRDRHEIPGTGGKLIYTYDLTDDIEVDVIDAGGRIDQRIGGLLFERMKRERDLSRLLQEDDYDTNRVDMLILGLRVLDLDRLNANGQVLALILMYMTARELRMIIEGYHDPLGPSSVSLLPNAIEYLTERFERITGMPLDEANDTRIRPEIPFPTWWNRWDLAFRGIGERDRFTRNRCLFITIYNDYPRPWSFNRVHGIQNTALPGPRRHWD